MLPALGSLVVAPVVTYPTTYLGWFVGENGWNRHWADTHGAVRPAEPARAAGPVQLGLGAGSDPLARVVDAHAYRFHERLDSGAHYQSNPWSWLVLGRPVDFYYDGSRNGVRRVVVLARDPADRHAAACGGRSCRCCSGWPGTG